MTAAGNRRSDLTEDEAMSGGVVWLCENGHVDVAHKVDGNHLNLCMRCKEGVCEPRRTLGRRSKAQREEDRALGIYKPRRRGARRQRPEAPVTVIKPGEAPRVVEAESLRSSPLQAAFPLTAEQREAILAGRPPRISFPRIPPADHPEGKPWPAAPGDMVDLGNHIAIAVTELRPLVAQIVLEYEVFDSRPPSGSSPITSIKPMEKTGERMGGPEIRAEREPEYLPRREVAKLANRVHESELRKLRETREDLGRHLQEQASAPRDVRFHLQESIKAIDRRIENIQRDMAA